MLEKDETINESDFLGHGTEDASENVEEIRNPEKARKSKALWIRLSVYYPVSRRISLEIAKLRNTRNKYDYCNDAKRDEAMQDLESYRRRVEGIMQVLEGLK